MTRDVLVGILVILLTMAGLPGLAAARIYDPATAGENFQVRGYLQANPVHVSTELPGPAGDQALTEYRLQNRLNLRWDLTSAFSCHWQMRTRVFAGDLVREFPPYVDAITRDDGVVDLSWTVIEEDDWLLHYIPDRLYAELDRDDWNVRVGRQRVNWGVNIITNPNDIFNIYSIYDFDYPERPGSDAVRIQRFLDFSSRVEFAASPGRDLENSVAAALYAFNVHSYDIQMLGGYYRERLATGAGWAGNLGTAGLKGETMFFSDIHDDNGSRDTNFILSASIDYMFSSGLFMVAEMLYNQKGGRDAFQLIAQRLTADNPTFSKYQAALQLTYPIHPLLDGTLTTIGYPDEESMFISPALTWSVIENLDMRILGQFFVAGNSEPAFDLVGHLLTASLKYSF